MKNIAIIPARSGSKGLKDKNIKLLNGKPLMWYSIQSALKSGCFDEIMVSTDSEKYAGIAIESGASVPFLRSPEMSSDAADSWDTVKEVLLNYQLRGKVFDSICLLQPTSPMRTADDIAGAYQEMNELKADAITSVCEVDHSPLWTMTLPEDKSLARFRKEHNSVQRQNLPEYFRLNGAIYVRKIDYAGGHIEIRDKREYAYVMKRSESIDIDTQEDFDLAEYLLICR